MKALLIGGAILVLIWVVDCLTGVAARAERRRERPPRNDWPKGDF